MRTVTEMPLAPFQIFTNLILQNFRNENKNKLYHTNATDSVDSEEIKFTHVVAEMLVFVLQSGRSNLFLRYQSQ